MASFVEDAFDVLAAAAGRARSEGHRVLVETDLHPVLRALGWRTPRGITLGQGDDLPDLSPLPGPRVVVKLLSRSAPHRSGFGGVRVVEWTPQQVGSALAALREASPDPDARLLIQEMVSHPHGADGELLVGARWSPEFGPVVTLTRGGAGVEERAVAEGASGPLVFSPLLASTPWAPAAPGRGSRPTGNPRDPRPGIHRDLGEALEGFSRLVDLAMPEWVTELEVNPLVFDAEGAVALDALAIVSAEVPRRRRVPPLGPRRREGIGRVLSPASVGLVGVSRRLNPGRVILRNLLAGGFPRDSIRVVKPGANEVEGCACVPDLASLAPGVDLLVLCVASREVPAMMDQIADGRLARSVVLIPGGLGEGGANLHLEEEVRRALGAAGDEAPVVNGGNCLGVRSLPGRLDTLFIPPERLAFPRVPPHPLALISQSGAFAIARASALPWLNPRLLVTVGNQIDLTVGEYLEVLADDPLHRVFGCYVEGFRELDGLRFLEVARRLSAQGRCVVLYRAGRTPQGADAVASHTASVAGDYRVTRALAEAAGVLVAHTLEDFEDLVTAAVLLDERDVSGPRLGALSNAGFECVALSDSMENLGPASFAPGTDARVRKILADHGLEAIVSPRNPLDVTPILPDGAYVEAARAILEDPGVDVGIVGCVPLTPALHTLEAEGGADLESGVFLPGLLSLWQHTRKAWVVIVDGGPPYDALARRLSDGGVPTYRRADRAHRALARYVAWRTRRP